MKKQQRSVTNTSCSWLAIMCDNWSLSDTDTQTHATLQTIELCKAANGILGQSCNPVKWKAGKQEKKKTERSAHSWRQVCQESHGLLSLVKENTKKTRRENWWQKHTSWRQRTPPKRREENWVGSPKSGWWFRNHHTIREYTNNDKRCLAMLSKKQENGS